MAGAKSEEIKIIDRSTIKELGDRFEIEWQLSALPDREWAETFQIAEVSERQGPPDWVGGGGPSVTGRVVRWFVPGEQLENADTEVRYRLSVANQRFGAEALLPITGLHHVRIPVSDAWRSRDWYVTVIGFVPVLDLQEELGLVGVVLRHPDGLVVGLHQDPSRAAALGGFAVLGLGVPDRDQLERWAERLDRLGIPYGPLTEGHLGWYLEVPDPDGIVVRFHSGTAPNAEEA